MGTVDSDPPESTPPGSTPLDYEDLDDTRTLVPQDPRTLTPEQRRRRKLYLRELETRGAIERYIRRIGWRVMVVVAIAAAGPIVERVIAWILR